MIQCAIIFIPFFGTSLGAAMVFFMKDTVGLKIEKLLLGFAAGVMLAASVWSLLLPSIEMAKEQGSILWLPALAGFLLGIAFLLVIDNLVLRLHSGGKREAGKGKMSKTAMMLFAVTVHNIPEGMAVGVTCAAAMKGNAGVTVVGAMALSLGIAIQNFPEGAIVSMPLKSKGVHKGKAFLAGVFSGAVEPAGAFITMILAAGVERVLPYLLSFAAGAMIYVVIEELIPEARTGEHGGVGTIGAAVGFALMMVLDVALG